MAKKNLQVENAQSAGNVQNAQVENAKSLKTLDEKVAKNDIVATQEAIAQEAARNEQALAAETLAEKAAKRAMRNLQTETTKILRLVKDAEQDIRHHLRTTKRMAGKSRFAELLEDKFAAIEKEIYKQGDYVVIESTITHEDGSVEKDSTHKCCVWKTRFESAESKGRGGKGAKIRPIANIIGYRYGSEEEVAISNFTEAYIERKRRSGVQQTIAKDPVTGKEYLRTDLDENGKPIPVYKVVKLYPCVTETLTLAEFSARFRKAMQVVFPEGLK